MAILKNLLVNGSSRFLNTSYFQDVSIAGSTALASLSLSGSLSVTGNTTLGGTLGVTGAATFSGTVTTNGTTHFRAVEIYDTTPYIDFHYNNSTADYTSRIIESSSGTLHIAKNLTIASTISASTGVISTFNSTNVNVTNNLRANHYDLQTVAQLGGSFYVSPTVKFPNSGTTLAVTKSGATLTLTITDSSITSTTMAGVVWTAGSGVKVSGTINGVVTGTMDGTVSSINTSSHVLTLSVSGENSANVVAGTYTASQFKDLSVMLYTRKQDGTSKMINTASGAIASFTDGGNNVPVKQLVVDIEPVQDLHGQDNPYPAGGGKNKLPVTASSHTINGVTFTVNEDGSVRVNGTATANAIFTLASSFTLKSGTYVLNGCPSGGGDGKYRIDAISSSASAFDYGSGATLSLSADTTFDYARVIVWSGQTVSGIVFKPMIRLSSVSDATFAPYSNICPITGHTSAVVTRTGKNLLKNNNTATTYTNNGVTFTTNSNGTITANGTATADAQLHIYISGLHGNCKFSGCPSGGGGGTYDVFPWDSATNARPKKWNGTTEAASDYGNTLQEIQIPSGHTAIIVIRVRKNYTANNVVFSPMIVAPTETSTTFESYNGQIYTIDLNGTRYGGTLDVTSGVLTVDRAIVSITSVQGKANTSVNKEYYFTGVQSAIDATKSIISDKYPYNANPNVIYNTDIKAVGVADNGIILLGLGADGPTDMASANTFLSNNPITVCYFLKTSQTVQLTANEVKTLLGQNNIWADTGDTNVIYETSQYDSTNNYNVGIWMNCYDQANSSSTIRVYDGSSRWPNVFLGNMTNADLPRVNGNEPYGYGLYSDNVFLRGIISATGGLIGNWTIGTTGMFYNSDAPSSTSITMIPGGTAASTTSIGGSSGSKSWIFTGKNLFGIDTTGKLYASSAEISGKITAQSGSIGGFHITSSSNQGTSSAGGHIYINSLYRHSGDGTTYEYEFGMKGDAAENPSSSSTTSGNLAFYVKRINKGAAWNGTNTNMFYVTHAGFMYCRNAEIAGKITATSGKIGGWSIGDDRLATESTNPYVLLAPGIGTNKDVFYVRTGSGTTADPYKWPIVMRANGYFYADNATITGNSIIGPWHVTNTSIYKGANTLGSPTSGAAYFGDLGLSIGNKFKVDASGNGAIILGELSEGKAHIEIDSDSFDVCQGAATGTSAVKVATFGEITRIGNGGSNVLIDGSGFSFTDIDGNEMMKISTDNVVIGKDGSSCFYVDSNSITLKDNENADVFKVESGGGNTVTTTFIDIHYSKFSNSNVSNGYTMTHPDENAKSSVISIRLVLYKTFVETMRDGDGNLIQRSYLGVSKTETLKTQYYTTSFIENKSVTVKFTSGSSGGVSHINNLVGQYCDSSRPTFQIMYAYKHKIPTYSNLNMSGNAVVSGSVAANKIIAEDEVRSDEVLADTSVTSGDFVFWANGKKINEVETADKSVTITSSNKIDSTPAIGAQLTLYSGIYLLCASGEFNSGSSSGVRNNQIAIYTGSSPTNNTLIKASRVRVNLATQGFAALTTQAVVTVPANTGQTFTVGLTSSIAQSSTSSTTLTAIYLRPPGTSNI